MPDLATNVLYYGDNLDILRRYLPDGAVDLVDLDPPFNSNRDDNVIFRDESGNATDAQLLAFEDTWHWGPSADTQDGVRPSMYLFNPSVALRVLRLKTVRRSSGASRLPTWLSSTRPMPPMPSCWPSRTPGVVKFRGR